MKTVAYIALFYSFVTGLAFSQNIDRAQQLDQVNKRPNLRDNPLVSDISTEEKVPEIIPGEHADMGPQFIVKQKKIRKWISAYVDSQYYYTSNAFLEEDAPMRHQATDCGLLVSTADFAVAPDPFEFDGDRFYPKVGFRHQWFNYGVGTTTDPIERTFQGLNSSDFDAQTIYTEGTYALGESWSFGTGFEFVRLLTHESSDGDFDQDYQEFYKEYAPKWSIERYFPINDSMFFSVRYDGKWRITDVDPAQPKRQINDRDDHSLTFAYTQEVLPKVYIQPNFRFQYSDYIVNGDRNDYLYNLGATISWSITDWASVRTFATWEHRESDDPTVADYFKIDSGGGVTLSLRF